MKKFILTALVLGVGLAGYTQNYLWGTYSYGADPNCGGFTSQYTPVETFVNEDHSLLSGGESVGGGGCDPSFGGVDIKIVKSNITGGIDYIKKIGTSADDHLVKILEDGHGNNILVGNTVSGGISTIFILKLDAQGNITSENTLTQNSPTGAEVLDAEKVGQSPIGFSGSIHLTGVEDDRMFYSELLIGNNNSFYQIHHKTINQTGTRGKSIEVAPYQGIFRVLIIGDRELWTIEPFYTNPSFTKVYTPSPDGLLTTIETKGNEVVIGSDAGEIFIYDVSLANVSYNTYGFYIGGQFGTVPVQISDIEITSNNEIIAGGINNQFGQEKHTFFHTDINGSLLNDGQVILTSQSIYQNSLSNKFGLDLFDNICVNYGLRVTNPGGFTSLQYEQERLIMVSRLDKDFVDNCTWNPLGLSGYNQGSSSTFTMTEPSYNSSLAAGGYNYQEVSNGIEEIVCEGSHCVGQGYEYAMAVDISSGQQVYAGPIGDPYSSGYCDWGFRGPSGSLMLNINFPGLQYYRFTYVLDGITFTFDINNSSLPFTLPDGIYSFTLFVIDGNGCPHFTEYCIPNYGEYEYGRLKSTSTERANNSLSVYPNPSTGNFNLSFEAEKYSEVIVRDLTGRIIKQVSLTQEDNSMLLDLSNEATGIYLISVIGEKGQENMKVTKQ